jgi:hypothetical protein
MIPPRFASLLALLAAAFTAGAALPTPGCPHPDATDWTPLFAPDLSNAIAPPGVWNFADGVLTASADECLWTRRTYRDFVLDLEFMTAEGTNSGVIIYASDTADWIPNSVEIQLADDFAEPWRGAAPTWQCGAMFGHQAATESRVLPPGRWNRLTLAAKGPLLTVALNGAIINEIDLRRFTSASVNPDGSDIPAWLSRPKADLATEGSIGLQGKHAGAPIYFRNLRIRALP